MPALLAERRVRTHARRRAARPAVMRLVAPPVSGAGRVVILGATVGQGHEGAARELGRRLAGSGVEVTVHDYIDAVPTAAAWILKDLYAPTVQHAPRVFDGIFRGLERPGALRRMAEVICSIAEPAVEQWIGDADVVVSTYPLASRTLGMLRRRGRLTATSMTYLTDPAAHTLWCDPDVDRHLTVTRATAADAARYGVDAVPAGPLCGPAFSAGSDPVDRASLGLPGPDPIVLLSAGSLGMGDVPRTVEAVLRHPRARVLVLCGRNDALRRRWDGDPRVAALGWRDDVPALMATADMLVHNAGGLSFTEALVAGLPALTYLPIPGHGRANAAILERSGIAAWPRTPDELVAAIEGRRRERTPIVPQWAAGADAAAVVRDELAARSAAGLRASGF
ncbi:glycosyltransferase [Pseudonocardia sp. N23]|uniref:MGDG synthase family glycosyltransferase n=1 Tax=Pseudonocardia sp. N23 TaxID=1987376 RepID=UPI000BFCDC1E|nr:glycosyltransferase [Pseudonocardia sp. N23]GAY10943.1 protein of unknown function UPF0089 [Pseudonocardia sp. N23]